MRSSVYYYIIYAIIFAIASISIITLYKIQNTYTCINNIKSLENMIITAALNLNTSYSNTKIVLTIPSSYEYVIYKDKKGIYIKDLRCNIKDRLDLNLTLEGEIISKRKIYLIKNSSKIYLSPYDIPIVPGNKESIPKYPITANKNEKTPKNNKKIIFIYVRSEKHNGEDISDSDLYYYAEFLTDQTKSIFIRTFNDLKPFNDPSSYEYYIVKSFLPVSFEDSKNVLYFTKQFSMFKSICRTVDKKNPLAIIFVILVDDKKLPYAGVSYLAIDEKKYSSLLSSASGCNSKILVFVQINLYYLEPSVLAHELGHAIGNLADQYLNACHTTYYFDVQTDKGENIWRYLEDVYKLNCNTLEKSLDAKITPTLSNFLDKYSKPLSSVLNLKEIKEDICTGNNIFPIYIKYYNIFALVRLKKPNEINIDLNKECDIIYFKNSKPIITSCESFFKNIGIRNGIGSYLLQLWFMGYLRDVICISNLDITGKTRDIMGVHNVGYYSKTSINAFKNNLYKIWEIS